MNDSYARLHEHLHDAIRERTLAPGDRLPTERQLAEQFGVSRSVARRALADLEASGLITRHVGRGTFVRAEDDTSFAPPPASGGSKELISPAEYIEVRLRFEPELAWMVATNGVTADFALIRECMDRAEHAKDAEEFELWDASFHKAIADATHNKLAIAMYDMIHTARREHAIWGSLGQRGQTPDHRLVYQREHRDIVAALQDRDPERAREIMSRHIRNTRRRLLDY